MLIQHYGAETTLARKITASLEALQLEIGCVSSTFAENYDELHLLATACWAKSLWERLYYYKFRIHLDYPPLPLPWKCDTLVVRLFWDAGYRGQQLQALNRCWLALKLLFLSDIATACGRLINIILVLQPTPQEVFCHLSFPMNARHKVIGGFGKNFGQPLQVQAGAYKIHSATGKTPPTGGGIGFTTQGTIFSFIRNAMEGQSLTASQVKGGCGRYTSAHMCWIPFQHTASRLM